MTHAGTVVALAALLLTSDCIELPTGLPGAPRTCESIDQSVTTYPTDSTFTKDDFCEENHRPSPSRTAPGSAVL
jgi:hypothetical protein